MAHGLRNGTQMFVGQAAFELLIKKNILHVLIDKSRTTWRTEMSMSFLSFSDNLFYNAYITFQVLILR